ncbi:MAG: conserved phage C-terminal domain-containing protein, partial [Draconibacterium sp.]|nr:conserved phage C-terminal domain-containing protein [Draconibacterium sp.]
HIPENHMVSVCFSLASPVVSKFVKDENGMYYNERMEKEIIKRREFAESRRVNGQKGGRPKKPSGKPSGKPSEEPTENLVEDGNINRDIIDYLNEKSGKDFKYSTKKTTSCIKARMEEGFTIEDFKKVIDNKVEDWSNDTKMNEYLRPETLFGNKFEGYLNRIKPVTNNKKIRHDSDFD